MSLYLPEQKLGSHSQESGASQKFILKGRQTGGMHLGHTWVFRAESHDTMMAWYQDLKVLTERTPEQRSEMFGAVSRSASRTSRRSTSSDARVVDEEDEEPFSAGDSVDVSGRDGTSASKRPQAGGRFPSDLQVNAQRGMQVAGSPSSGSSGQAGAGPGYNTGYDEPQHVAAVAQGAYDGNGKLYQPTPIHGATATNIYQYQTPVRGNSYAEQGGAAPPQGHEAAAHHHEMGAAYVPVSHAQGGHQGGEHVHFAGGGPEPAGATAQPRTVDGEHTTEDAPKQGINRTDTSTMHIPGGYPKSSTNATDGVAG